MRTRNALPRAALVTTLLLLSSDPGAALEPGQAGMIIELGVGMGTGRAKDGWLSSDVGWIRRGDGPDAWGLSFHSSFEGRHQELRNGFKLRYRRYLEGDLNIDVGAGALFWGGGFRESHPAFTAQIAVGYKDWVATYVGVDGLRSESLDRLVFSPGPQDRLGGTTVHAGARLGGWPGLTLTGVAVGLAVLAMFAIAASG